MAKIEVRGLDKLQKALKGIDIEKVKVIVRQNGAELQKKMQDKADFVKGYQTGQTKRSIGLEIHDGGFSAEVGPTTEYSPYLEYGTRYMDAQPFVKPALDEQEKQFKRDLENHLKDETK